MWRPSVVGWGIARLMAAQLRVQSPLRGLWALLTCAAWGTTYYDQCQSSTTSTVVKAPQVRASLVKRRYIKYLALPFSQSLPASNAASRVSLELHDDLCQFHVAFFLEVRQHSSSEEDLALADAVQISIEIQRLNLPSFHSSAHSVCARNTVMSHRPTC